MKSTIKSSLLLISIIIWGNCFSQSNSNISKEVIRFSDEIKKSIKKYSMVSNEIDWKQLEQTINSLEFSRKEDEDKNLIIKTYIKVLRDKGDKHSFFRTNAQIQNYKKKDSTTIFSTSKYLENNIGYLKLPAFSSYNQETTRKYANTIRNQIQQLDTTYVIKSWVVDLRNNGGGNMWPMIAGINSLMNDGIAGYFLSNKNHGKTPWIIRNGIINYSNLTINNYKIKQPNVKIAILINNKTGSSGEMTAISMIGLKNSKTFGQATAGYTTVNSSIILKDKTELYLATGYCADRNNKKYIDEIVPDQIVNGDSHNVEDLTLVEAIKWLTNK